MFRRSWWGLRIDLCVWRCVAIRGKNCWVTGMWTKSIETLGYGTSGIRLGVTRGDPIHDYSGRYYGLKLSSRDLAVLRTMPYAYG